MEQPLLVHGHLSDVCPGVWNGGRWIWKNALASNMHKGIVTLLYWLKDLTTWWSISQSTRLSVRPSIHQSHCLRRLFFSRLNFPQLISRFFPRQNSMISIARLSYSFRIFCLETKFYDSGTLRIYPPTRTLLYLFLCWNDPEVFNTKSQL